MTTSGHNSAALLKEYIDRINDRLDAKQVIADEVKDIYSSAKDAGVNIRGLREHIRQMREDAEKKREKEEALEAFRNALGQFGETELGSAAINRLAAG